jgi:WD40 repeat protein
MTMGDATVLWERAGHSPFMWWPGWSPDGKRLATAEMKAPTMVLLLDGDTGKDVARIRAHNRAVNTCTYHPSGKMFATAGSDGWVTVRGPRGGLKWEHQLFKNQSESVDWSPDGKKLAVSGRDGSILVLDPESGKVEYSWAPGPVVLAVRWHPDGKRLAVAREDSRVMILKPHSKESVMLVHRGPVADLAWSPKGDQLATASADGSVRVWSAQGHLDEMPQRPNREGAASVAWSPDGIRLASACWDGAVRVWIGRFLELEDREGHGPPVAVQWRPGAEAQLLVGRSKGPLRLIDLL